MHTPCSAGSPESNRGGRIAQPRATLRSWDGASKEEPPTRFAQPRATLRSWDGASKEEPPTRFAQPRATLRSWGGASKEVHPTRKQIDGSDAMKSFWQRKVLGMQGPPQKRAAYAAPTGVRFPRTSLTCHSEDLREGGCWECRVHPRDRRLAPRQPGFLSPHTSIVRTAHHRHPPVPAPHVSRHASLRPAALLTRGGRPAPAAQTCLAHRPGLNPCCTHPAGRVACLLRPSTPPALARLRWTPVPPARAAGPPPHASASTPTASPDGSSPSRESFGYYYQRSSTKLKTLPTVIRPSGPV